MPADRFARIAGVFGLCLLTAPLLCPGWPRSRPSPTAAMSRAAPPPPASPSDAARRTARWYYYRAQRAVNAERDLLESWDPIATENINEEAWRRQLMTADRSGDLKAALKWGRHAAALARTPEQAGAAARLLSRLECEAGHPKAELEQARKLMALKPGNEESLILLHRAADCNHLVPLANKSAAALRKMGYGCAMENDSPHRE